MVHSLGKDHDNSFWVAILEDPARCRECNTNVNVELYVLGPMTQNQEYFAGKQPVDCISCFLRSYSTIPSYVLINLKVFLNEHPDLALEI